MVPMFRACAFLRDKQSLGQRHVRGRPSARPVGLQDAVGVHHVQDGSLVHGADVGDALLQVQLVEGSPVPDDAHVVLHGHGEVGAAMVFQDGDVDPHVAVQNGFVHLGCLQLFGPWQADGAVIAFQMGRHHFGACGLGRRLDAAVVITFAPVFTRMVKHDDLRGTRRKTLPDDLSHQFRIGVSGQFGCLVPTDVRLYGHFHAGFHKLFHASQIGNGPAEHFFGLSAHDGHQIHFLSVCSGKSLRQHVHRFQLLYCHYGCACDGQRLQKISSVHKILLCLLVIRFPKPPSQPVQA